MEKTHSYVEPDELDQNEVQAVEQLKQGNIEGLEYLVKKFELMAVRAAVLITCEKALAEDIVQESFIQAYERIHQFQPHRPFRPWFIRSVVNAALRATQKRDRQQGLGPAEIEKIESGGNRNGRAPETLLEQAETNREIWQALGSLTPKERSTLVLRYFAGLSVKELSLLSGTPAGTIKWRLRAARKQLKGALILKRDPILMISENEPGVEK